MAKLQTLVKQLYRARRSSREIEKERSLKEDIARQNKQLRKLGVWDNSNENDNDLNKQVSKWRGKW